MRRRFQNAWAALRGRQAPPPLPSPPLNVLGRSIIDGVEDALVVTDADLRVVEWNVAMERLAGVARPEALGQDAARVLPFLPEVVLAGHFQRALRGGVSATGEIAYTVPRRGRQGWVSARFVPRWDGAGRVVGVAGFYTEVSERHRRALFVRAIEAIGHSLTSSLDLNEVLDTIVGKTLEVMGAESALAVSWDGAASHFTVMRAAGRLSGQYAAAGAIPVGGGPISHAVLEGRPFTTPDVLSDPRVWLEPGRRAQIEREGFKAVAAAPLVSKQRVHGALIVHYWRERVFGDEDVAALQLIAEHAALAIDNARLYADATRRADRLRELAEVERLVASSLELDEVLRRIAEATARLVDAPVVQVWTADAVARRLRLRAASVEPGTADARMPTAVAFGEGIVGQVARDKAPLYVDDVGRDPRALSSQWARETGIQKMLDVPILSGDELLGVLAVRSRTLALGSEENRALVTSFATQAAVAIQNARAYTGALQRAAQLRELAAVSQRISGTLDLDRLLRSIAEAAAQLSGVRFVLFWLADEGRRQFSLSAGSEPAMAEDYPHHVIGYDEGGIGWIARHRAPLVVDDVNADDRMLGSPWWQRWGLRSYMGLPVMVGSELLAALSLCHREPVRLSAETRDILDLFVVQAATAIQNARLYRDAQRRRDVAEILARLGRELTAILDLDRIAELVVRGTAELVPARGSAVLRYDPEDGTLRPIATFGVGSEAMAGIILGPGEGMAGRAIATRKVVATADILEEPGLQLSPELRARNLRHGYRAVIAVPLLTHERVVGALVVGDERGREFSPDEVQTLQAVADQAALALENARLYASARDSLERLRDTQAQLVQAAKMSALGQLVSGVAHELNNPLSVIIGYGQLMLSRTVPEALRRQVELMVAQADRMAKIVRNLLFFARQRPPERSGVNLNQVIEQTLSLRLNQLTLSGIVVEKEFAESLPVIGGDAQQLEQVFLNLLLNAEQAILETRQGGRIVFRTRVVDDGRTIRAQVIDDGPGIPPEVLPRVFEPFFTTKTVGTGTGLGLSVSYGIVQEHRGRLTVGSRPGETVFTLELPVDERTRAEAAAPPVAPAGPVSFGGRVALVVEDEPAVLDLVCTLLGNSGWRVEVAPGGRAGLERVRRGRYDLIVSDMRMPEGNGEDFYRSAVAVDPALSRRFLFITGDTANREAWGFLKGANVPIIEKPFQPAAFLDTVRTVVAASA